MTQPSAESRLPESSLTSAEAARPFLDHLYGDQLSVIEPSRRIWTAEVAEEVRHRIEDAPDEGPESTWVKLGNQMAGASREAILLVAEMTYLRELPLVHEQVLPSTKREHVHDILSWSENPPSIPPSMERGFEAPGEWHGGMGYLQYLWAHLVWLAKFVKVWSALTPTEQEAARRDPWALHGVADTVKRDIPSIRACLLYLTFPDIYLPSVSARHKRQIRDAFAHEIRGATGNNDLSVDKDLYEIRQVLERANGGAIDFYLEPFAETWRHRRKVDERAWAVRQRPGGHELETWLAEGFVSLEAAHLTRLGDDATKAQVRDAIDSGYEHVDYVQRIGLTEDYFAFLTRMKHDDLVVARRDDQVWLGRISGPPEYTDDEPRLRRAVEWQGNPVDAAALPPAASSLLATPSRNVIDLTDSHDALEQLLVDEDGGDLEGAGEPAIDGAQTGPQRLRRGDDALARALFTGAAWIDDYIALLESRRQVIVHGPPGTGKTFVARKIARHVAGDDQVQLVQFHPSYAYEDFFEGFRPRAQPDGSLTFDKVPGPLRRIAADAASNPGIPYVLIIDEINRGNLAKVFGELYFLLEYRDENVTLQYSPETPFTLPKNLFIIGTMNTADRSIAMVDAAIRRRFSFIEMHPDVEPVRGLLTRWLEATGQGDFRADLLAALNAEIGEEDREFKIGPSYLMRDQAATHGGLEQVWRHDILPLLEEHYYGRLTRAQVMGQFSLDALKRRITQSELATAGSDEAPEPSDL
ncbi:McrB family protein [Luteimicrobium subarcticum]|uniref:5-methylcytosine-specific restriction protein B n=1 Tax=Luteimicrobium subarcticum TaxID=620910 RepID=A0A2M8WRT4_9MICO|nr:AAA family ATPase [Luteimicrobium subarcticum]PJI93556.1 5-methylcytosine-specific restriction protein B [Luteimicrobium subarcticum]